VKSKKLTLISLLLLAFTFPATSEENGNAILKKLNDRVLNNAKLKGPYKSEVFKDNAYCNNDEEQFLEIENNIIEVFSASFQDKKIIEDKLKPIISENFQGIDFPPKLGKIINNFTDENIIEHDFLTSDISINKTAYLDSFKNYIDNFKKVEYIKLDTLGVYSSANMRKNMAAAAPEAKHTNDAEGNKMKSANLLVHFDIRKIMSNGQKVNDRGEMNISVFKEKNKWKVSAVELLKGTSLISNKEALFSEITASAFKNILPTSLRREAIRRGGYATSVGDFDNDGIQDIFFAAADKIKLFKGNADATFTEVTDSGIENHDLVKSSAFIDLFNTGKQDLVLARFNPFRTLMKPDNSSDIIVYKNIGNGKFSKIETPLNFKNKHDYAMPMALADFNQDGLIDIYIGFPGARDFTMMKEKTINKDYNELHRFGFFYNQGLKSQNFVEIDKSKISWEEQFDKKFNFLDIFPHSAAAVDLDLDGFMDVVTIDDRAKISPVFMGMAGGNLKQVNKEINFTFSDYGMGSAFGDIFSTGNMDMLLTSVNFIPSQRIKNSCSGNWAFDTPTIAGIKGLRLFKREGSSYSEISDQVGLNFSGEGMAGVELIDYNNDGNLDIFVSNGLWSGTDKNRSTDLTSLIARSASLGLFEEEFIDKKSAYQAKIPNFNKPIGQEGPYNQNDNEFLSDTFKSRSAIVSMLSFAKTTDNLGYSFAGHQRKRVYRNNGNGTFTEVGYALGLDSEADGYMIAYTDFNKDGKLDIVYRNADPGVDVNQFPPLQLFVNNFNQNNSVILKLQGSNNSNKDAIGALVTAKIGNKKIIRQLTAMSGTIQSEKLIHIGLGKENSIDELQIRWPDGMKQEFKNIKKGFHNIEEPYLSNKNALN
jgi:hypothetical protein